MNLALETSGDAVKSLQSWQQFQCLHPSLLQLGLQQIAVVSPVVVLCWVEASV
jgi:hypothetical protein